MRSIQPAGVRLQGLNPTAEACALAAETVALNPRNAEYSRLDVVLEPAERIGSYWRSRGSVL